jgi:hypothetical protein
LRKRFKDSETDTNYLRKPAMISVNKTIRTLGTTTLIFVMLGLLMPASLSADASAEISHSISQSDTVDMGMIYAGSNDTLWVEFSVKNTGTISLRSFNLNPSYFFGYDPDYIQQVNNQDYLEFEMNFRENDPIIVDPSETKSIYLQYPTTTPTSFTDNKLKYALMKLGVYDSKLGENLPDKDEMDQYAAHRQFTIIARRSEQYVDGYDELVDFDSVYVTPPEYIWPWRVQNVSEKPYSIISQELELLTTSVTDPEITFTARTLPLELAPKDNPTTWGIKYYPRDRGFDSAHFQLGFIPDPGNYPDSIAYAECEIRGVGVEQEIALRSALSATITGIDTLDFGDIRVNDEITAVIEISNNGNLNFNSLGQSLVQIDRYDAAEDFYIENDIDFSTGNMWSGESKTFTVKFAPKRKGPFLARYIIESDIINRNIFGYPKSAENVVVYLKGRGTEPKLAFPADTVNVGNVVYRPDCVHERDTLVAIGNTGNSLLIVTSITCMNPTYFSVDAVSLEIPPSEIRYIKIKYEAQSSDEVNFADIVFETNASAPYNTMTLVARGAGVPALAAELYISTHHSSKPGRFVNIPVLLDREVVVFAKNYSDTLNYDSSILKYERAIIRNTASENVSQNNVSEAAEGGRLFIHLAGSNYFSPNDSLIILQFSTYLGDRIETTITFEHSMFGDGICPNVLDVNAKAGIFALDSVCGLMQKIGRTTALKAEIVSCSPNPVNTTAELEYNLPYDADIEIILFNSFGTAVRNIFKGKVKKGVYGKNFSVDGLSSGLYYCELRTGLLIKTMPIVINK